MTLAPGLFEHCDPRYAPTRSVGEHTILQTLASMLVFRGTLNVKSRALMHEGTCLFLLAIPFDLESRALLKVKVEQNLVPPSRFMNSNCSAQTHNRVGIDGSLTHTHIRTWMVKSQVCTSEVGGVSL